MNKAMKSFVMLIGIIFVFSQYVSAASTAPQGIVEIIEELAELEESYENNQWQEALETTNKIENELKEVFEQSKLEDAALENALTNLKNAVIGKNEEKTEIKYLLFQKRFFAFINNFEYDVHPLLGLIEKYVIEESAEAAEKGDFKDVASEMAEAGNLIKYAEPVLVEKGITKQELSEFSSKVVDVIRAAKKNDAEQVNQNLKQVQDLYKSFMIRAK